MSSGASPEPISPIPPPPPPLVLTGPKTQVPEEKSPLQEIYYAIKKLPKWREEEDFEKKSIWLATNSHVNPLIQEGPTCGLVVLQLAMRMLQRDEIDVEYLLEEAGRRSFTLQGEMFSAKNMLNLATSTSGCSGEILTGGLQRNRQKIISSLQRLQPVLVPYDADFNHEPACRGGHRAHWSLLTGYLVRIPSSLADVQLIQSLGFSSDPACANVYHTSPPTTLGEDPLDLFQPVAGDDGLFVFTRQGKSKHLGAWQFSSLADSNEDLKQFSPFRDNEEYLLPPGGIEEGLCGKALHLFP